MNENRNWVNVTNEDHFSLLLLSVEPKKQKWMTGFDSHHQNKALLYKYQTPLPWCQLSHACGHSHLVPLAHGPACGSAGCFTQLQGTGLLDCLYKHSLLTLNPAVIVVLTSTAKSLKTTANAVWLLCPHFDTIILSSSPAEPVARTRRAILTELLMQTAWLSSADVHSSQLTF